MGVTKSVRLVVEFHDDERLVWTLVSKNGPEVLFASDESGPFESLREAWTNLGITLDEGPFFDTGGEQLNLFAWSIGEERGLTQ